MKGIEYAITDWGNELYVAITEVHDDKEDEYILEVKHMDTLEEAFEFIKEKKESN